MLRSRHLLGLKESNPEEIKLILDTTDAMKEVLSRPINKVPTLRGKMVVTLFYESSTRTRMRYSAATIFRLSRRHGSVGMQLFKSKPGRRKGTQAA